MERFQIKSTNILSWQRFEFVCSYHIVISWLFLLLCRVFPAEACDTIGGDACAASMFPEAKLSQPQESSKTSTRVIEEIDREYFDYDSEPNR